MSFDELERVVLPLSYVEDSPFPITVDFDRTSEANNEIVVLLDDSSQDANEVAKYIKEQVLECFPDSAGDFSLYSSDRAVFIILN